MKKNSNRIKRAIVCLLAGVCLLPLAACGQETPAKEASATTAPQTTAAATTTQPATTQAATIAPTTAATIAAPTETTTAAQPTTSATTKKTAATTQKSTAATTRAAATAAPTTYDSGASSLLEIPVVAKSETFDLKYGVRMRRELIDYYMPSLNGGRTLVRTEQTVSFPRRDYSASYSDLLPAAKKNRQTYADWIQEVLRITNQYRAEKGLPALKLDSKLTEIASVRAEECAWSGDHNHYRPNGKYFTSIFREAGMSEGLVGENIGWGYQSPKAVCEAWKASETHYENIINSRFTKIGIGVAADPDPEIAYCWIQHFSE